MTPPDPVIAGRGGSAGAILGSNPAQLPELANVPWRSRLSPEALRAREWRWTAWTVAISTPFFAVAALLVALEPLLFVVSLWSIGHGVAIPALYARRGARSVVPLGGARSAARVGSPSGPERVALGLLGDLVGHEARDLVGRTGLLPERGRLGIWLLGERGALLVRPGGRRVDCWCVRIGEAEDLPAADRVSHLLLALREDELGFATVANMDFSGATWRVRRRLEARTREALEIAVERSRRVGSGGR